MFAIFLVFIFLIVLMILCKHTQYWVPTILLIMVFFMPLQMGAYFYGDLSSFGVVPAFTYAGLFFCPLYVFKYFPKIYIKHGFIILLFCVFFAYMLIITQNVPVQLISNCLMPFLFFLWISNRNKDYIYTQKIRNTIAYTIILLAVYAIIEFLAKSSLYDIFWAMETATSNKYDTFSAYYRVKTTIGHPLLTSTIALIIMASTPLTGNKKLNMVVYLSLWIIIVSTGSRSAFGIAIIYNIYKLFMLKNIVTSILFLLMFIFSLIIAYCNGIFDVFIYRHINESASAELRFYLMDNVPKMISMDHILGMGIGATADFFKDKLGIPFIVENPWLQFYIDLGIFGLGFLLLMIFLILKKIGFTKKRLEMCFVTGIMISSYNSIAIISIVPIFFLMMYWLTSNKEQQWKIA